MLEVKEMSPLSSSAVYCFRLKNKRYPTGLYLESKSTPKKEWYIAITKANAEKLKEMELAKKNSELVNVMWCYRKLK